MNQSFFDLNKRKTFPDPGLASAENEFCIGFGGGMSVERLIAAYKSGIFPWYTYRSEPYWFSPDPRCVLFPDELHISKSMKQLLKSEKFIVTYDQQFDKVVKACASVKRKNDSGTWISKEFVNAYIELHKAGFAHSVEVMENNKLVGGLYGVSLGKCFFGESMFSKTDNASKFGLIRLVQQLKGKKFLLIDCQVHNPHLESLGAKNIPRSEFLSLLKKGLRFKTLKGTWAAL